MSPEKNQATPNSGLTILVADDDPLIQEVLQTKLEKSGYRVKSALDGEETLASIQQEIPDLLILDIKMPGVDGLEICRRLKAEEKTRALPILMLTAYGGVDHIVKGLEAGADDYVTKPFQMEEVMMRVRALLRMRDIESQLREKESHLARVQTVGQLLVTMAHHINNSLAIMQGRAQSLKVGNAGQVEKFQNTCLQQTRRIQAVLKSLEELVQQMEISTTSYAGSHLEMLDIDEEINRRLRELKDE